MPSGSFAHCCSYFVGWSNPQLELEYLHNCFHNFTLWMFNNCSVNAQVWDGYRYVLDLIELCTLFSTCLLSPRVHLPSASWVAHLVIIMCWTLSCVCASTSHHDSAVNHTPLFSPVSQFRSRDSIAYWWCIVGKWEPQIQTQVCLPLKPCVWEPWLSRKGGRQYPLWTSHPGLLIAWVRIAPGVISRMAT